MVDAFPIARACSRGALVSMVAVVPASFVYVVLYQFVSSAPFELLGLMEETLWAIVFASAIALVAVPLYGVPMFLLLRRARLANLGTMAFAGAIPGALYWWLINRKEHDFGSAAIYFGVVIAVTFYVVASKMTGGQRTVPHETPDA